MTSKQYTSRALLNLDVILVVYMIKQFYEIVIPSLVISSYLRRVMPGIRILYFSVHTRQHIIRNVPENEIRYDLMEATFHGSSVKHLLLGPAPCERSPELTDKPCQFSYLSSNPVTHMQAASGSPQIIRADIRSSMPMPCMTQLGRANNSI